MADDKEGRMADDEGVNDEGNETDEGVDDGSEGGTGGDAGKGRPPAYEAPSRDEWLRVTSALRDANAESKRRKEELRRIAVANATDDEKRAAEIADKVRSETESAWRPRLIAAEARLALAAAGCRDVARFGRLVDTSAVEIGDDGGVVGIEDQVRALKADFPEVFSEKEKGVSGSGQGGAANRDVVNPGSSRPTGKTKTASQVQADRLLGRR
jgi:hypothetical protein